MLRHVLFDMNLFDGEDERENSQKRILWLLEALTCCNQLWLKQHPETPLIYNSGIKYKVPAQFERDDSPEISTIRAFLMKNSAPRDVMSAFKMVDQACGGGEVFREIPRIIENGGGDCDNVASWRAAELRQHGIQASPYITWRRRADGGMTYHVVVRWPDGSSEDPSLLLGMGGEDRAADRAEEERKLHERRDNFIEGLQRTKKLSGGMETIVGRGGGGGGGGGRAPGPGAGGGSRPGGGHHHHHHGGGGGNFGPGWGGWYGGGYDDGYYDAPVLYIDDVDEEEDENVLGTSPREQKKWARELARAFKGRL